MTPLRRQMIEAMQLRGFAERTQESYLYAVTALTRYYRRSPAQLGVGELQQFFKHLAVERGLSGASCRLYLNGIRFFYLHVLKWPGFEVPLVVPKLEQRIPELLTRAEVARILAACGNPKHRMLLALCYGAGLRVSEAVAVRVRHLDGERGLLRIEQGKGAKDRLVTLAPGLLAALRHYWRRYRPGDWLFPSGRAPDTPISVTTAQKVFLSAKRKSGIAKDGGIHSLRHAYATHQLEQGLPVHQLQRLLGHGNLQSTMRYVHWVPGMGGSGAHADLIGALGARHE
jgi:integrase/recombinase XerD